MSPLGPVLGGYSPECAEGLFSEVRPSPKERSSPLPISKLSRRVLGPKRTLKEVEHMNGGKGIYVGGTLISILISLALYFSGKRETAIFVGLWAPTILNLGQSLMDED
jgi:hypothetical protein